MFLFQQTFFDSACVFLQFAVQTELTLASRCLTPILIQRHKNVSLKLKEDHCFQRDLNRSVSIMQVMKNMTIKTAACMSMTHTKITNNPIGAISDTNAEWCSGNTTVSLDT